MIASQKMDKVVSRIKSAIGASTVVLSIALGDDTAAALLGSICATTSPVVAFGAIP